ncbi:hypothetical protein ACIP86_12790 [Pseudomonas neuropathica]
MKKSSAVAYWPTNQRQYGLPPLPGITRQLTLQADGALATGAGE